jgi:Kef-type K+ transport system membrane component KefB
VGPAARARAVQVAFIVLYSCSRWQVVRWSRGVLPVAAALGIVMLVFALGLRARLVRARQAGFTEPALPADVIGC